MAQFDNKPILLLAIAAISLIGILLLQPIHQDQAYHQFADTRSVFGIPNFANVSSNIPFFFVGCLGLYHSIRRSNLSNRLEWSIAFAGIALVGPGSACYHWAPADGSLVWDRLPMAIGFMAVLSAVLAETGGDRLGRATLVPALTFGLISVAYWHYTSDLRLYVWVQFMPLLVIAASLALFQTRHSHTRLLTAALLLYIAAKAAEIGDAQIYTASGFVVSGHTLKHLLAAAACYCLDRRLLAKEQSDSSQQ
jgi:preprotein translocase subunit SecG